MIKTRRILVWNREKKNVRNDKSENISNTENYRTGSCKWVMKFILIHRQFFFFSFINIKLYFCLWIMEEVDGLLEFQSEELYLLIQARNYYWMLLLAVMDYIIAFSCGFISIFFLKIYCFREWELLWDINLNR